MTRALHVLLTGGIFHPFHATSSHLSQSFAALGLETEIFDDVEAGLARVRDAGPALLTLNLLRWRMAGEKYDADREAWRFELSAEGQKTIEEHVEIGGGLLALHTASICFDAWPGWADLLGGRWAWGESYHPELGPVDVEPTGVVHPITAGLPSFSLRDEVYTKLSIAPDTQGLLEAPPGDGADPQPLLWARTCGAGRVVYDALGHDVASMAHPVHARILARAALWACKRDDEVGGL